MELECKKLNSSKKDIEDFLSLTSCLYKKKNDVSDKEEIIKLLSNNHILSKYFRIEKFCIYQRTKVVGRFILTFYQNDNNAYIGFVECVNNDGIFGFMLEKAEFHAKKNNCTKLIGPLNASFWIGYRLKIDNFNQRPYTSEPYNKPYYYDEFIKNGYEVMEKYTSSFFRRIEKGFNNSRLEKRYNDFVNKGYVIKSPTKDEFNKVVDEIYDLVSELYSDFPVYKSINREDFCQYMSRYQTIINLDMVKMAYYNGKAVAFFVAIPNYNNLVFHTDSMLNIVKILFKKIFVKEYIFLYMGVSKDHVGLGSAISHRLIKDLENKKIRSISSLVHGNKITKGYDSRIIDKVNHYVLLSKNID